MKSTIHFDFESLWSLEHMDWISIWGTDRRVEIRTPHFTAAAPTRGDWGCARFSICLGTTSRWVSDEAFVPMVAKGALISVACQLIGGVGIRNLEVSPFRENTNPYATIWSLIHRDMLQYLPYQPEREIYQPNKIKEREDTWKLVALRLLNYQRYSYLIYMSSDLYNIISCSRE